MIDRNSGVYKAVLDRISEYAWPKPLAEETEMLTRLIDSHDAVSSVSDGTFGTHTLLPLLSLVLMQDGVSPQPGRPLAILAASNAEITRLKEAMKQWRASGLTVQYFYDRTANYLAADRLSKGLHLVCATPSAVMRLLQEGLLKLDDARGLYVDDADGALEQDAESLAKLLEAAQAAGLPRCAVTTPAGEARFAALQASEREPEASDAPATESVSVDKPVEVVRDGGRDLAPPKIDAIEWSIPQTGEHYVYVPTSRMAGFLEYLVERLAPTRRIAVYAMTRERAEFAKNACEKLGLSVACLHSMVEPEAMIENVQNFIEGRSRVIVLSDACVRFFDLPEDAAVVNFDLPRTVELYNLRVNRVGTSMRCALALTFVHPSCAELLPRYAFVHGTTVLPANPYEVNVRSREDFSRDFGDARSKRAAKRHEKRQQRKQEKEAAKIAPAADEVSGGDVVPEDSDRGALSEKNAGKKTFKSKGGRQQGVKDHKAQGERKEHQDKNERRERPQDKDARKKETRKGERVKPAQKARWDEDNFGNSIHYQPKKRNLRHLASDQPIHWEPTDPFHPSAQALSLPQLMPDERRVSGMPRNGKKGGNGRGGFNRR